MYQFIETERTGTVIFAEYLAYLNGCNDDFWEGHLTDSRIYLIEKDGEAIGLTGIHQNENLTFFYARPTRLRHASPAFDAMLETLRPRYAYVPTNDELFLSLCLDRHTTIEKQAYFFRHGSIPVRPPEYGRELLRRAVIDDAADILDSEGVEENIRLGKYYVLHKDGCFIGQGFMNPMTLFPSAASIGMSVHPQHRKKGVGRSIIMHLSDICHEKGLMPVCGCWYYNHLSRRTLESAGFVTKTRLLKVWLPRDTSGEGVE